MSKQPEHNHEAAFVRWFRDSTPYINAFRGKVFVLSFGGEMLADAQFASLVHDIVLLNSLGVRLVLVHGTRPQIEDCLHERNADMQYVKGLRLTDDDALNCVTRAAGSVRIEIEALLSMGLANSPMAGADIRVVSGNFVTAQPLGVRNGVDYCHTGEVRRIDSEAIHQHLRQDSIVLLSPVGYSPSGETFNLCAEDLATEVAMQMNADKLIQFIDGEGITDTDGNLLRELTLTQAEQQLRQTSDINESVQHGLQTALHACRADIPRCHIISRHVDGALLLELFTRDGIGTLITAEHFEDTRQASIEDMGGLLELLKPLEEQDILVRRSRERLEMEIEHFSVVERDGMIIACSALYPYIDEHVAELACLAVHDDYRNQGRGDALLKYMERNIKQLGITRLFVLTTRTAHWFLERGFQAASIESLPVQQQNMYNYKRQSKVFIKDI